MRGLLLALAVLSPLSARAMIPEPPSDPNALVRIVGFAAPPAVITCAQGSARLVEGAAPPPKSWRQWRPPPGANAFVPPTPPTSQTYTFSVDAEGRVLDLKDGGGPALWIGDEQAAVVASWRFAPGSPARGCQIDLAPTYTPLAEASPARLVEVLVAERRSAVPALRTALDGDCHAGTRRRPQTIVYPDLRAFDDRSVDPAWAGLRYDIDAAGAVRNVRVAAQHGESAFADAAASAVAEARFFPGAARTGCLATFRATPRATEAPSRPKAGAFDRPTDSCTITREALNISNTKLYPPAYGKRRVAGWAILRFDVAPWGQVGAIEVLESQPSAAFGQAARDMLQSARPNPPASGYRGCVVPLIFAIPPVPDEDDGG